MRGVDFLDFLLEEKKKKVDKQFGEVNRGARTQIGREQKETKRVRVSSRARGGMPTKGERGKATDFSIAAIMAPRGPSFGHYHLQDTIGNAAATANTSLECPTDKEFVTDSTLDHRKYICVNVKSVFFFFFFNGSFVVNMGAAGRLIPVKYYFYNIYI